MDEFLTAFAVAFTPQIFIAMVGGLIGAGFSSDVKTYGWKLTAYALAGAVLISAAVADSLIRYFHLEVVWVLGVAGLFAGIPSGALMDAIKLASPKLMGHLVDGVGFGIIDKLIVKFFPAPTPSETKQPETENLKKENNL